MDVLAAARRAKHSEQAAADLPDGTIEIPSLELPEA
jgi:hypothetical protein